MLLRRLTRRSALLARGQDGFTMITVVGLMLVGTLFSAAIFATAFNDIAPSAWDRDHKQAQAAAQAGINYYAYQLTRDPNYWTKCTNVGDPNPGDPNDNSPVNQKWDGSGNDPRVWRNITGSRAQYTIELLPAPGQTSCVENSGQSMLDPATTSFRIRATGRVNGVKRSLIGTFRRREFVDYIYFSDYETLDPITFGSPEAVAWGEANCAKYYRAGRHSSCQDITWVEPDAVNGPFHTNDEMKICGRVIYGRNSQDVVESSAPAPGWRSGGSCTGNPDFRGVFTPNAPILLMPPANTELLQAADPAYRFTGTTTIVLNGANMTVTNPAWQGTRTMALPSNGVIYVQNGSCGITGYSLIQNYTNPSGCADVWVRGTHSSSLTIGADNDIVINGDVTHTGSNTVLGLIANYFVRVYHPVTNRNGYTCTNASGTMSNVRIDASILSLRHSFIVDNYFCGAALQTIEVNGSIAQKFRGPVGTFGGSGTGYQTKDYEYDDALRYVKPPSFLNPVLTSWRVARVGEQRPPR